MNVETDPTPRELTEVSLTRFAAYFLWLGTVGFGGPIALAGHMQQDLVDERGWVSKEDYVEGLALAQLAPGPLAAQLAIYLGYVQAGVLGATAVGVAFVLPSFLMVLALSAAYVRFGGLAWMQGMFYGIGAAVIGIITRSAFKLTKLTLGKDKLLWGIFAVLAISTAWTSQEIIWLFLLAGVVALLVKSFPIRLPARSTVAFFFTVGAAGAGGSLLGLFFYFAKAGMFVFGSGLAVVPFLYGGVVQGHHWLTDRQFVDAVAVAMITPGPVVITVAFIGYLVAGLAGATAAALGIFLPVYLVVVLLAPSYKRWAKNPQLNAFVRGVTAAATGAIAGAVVVLARRSVHDVPTIVIAIVTFAVLFRWKVPEPLLIACAAIAGLLLRPA
ncbi:MAG: chromate transporter [Acidobacteriales bacterium 13_2_20CM_55_8]|nr:MAG: chromate transporter [Acidobacteriales bacterium 13_2_20CM_55_8]